MRLLITRHRPRFVAILACALGLVMAVAAPPSPAATRKPPSPRPPAAAAPDSRERMARVRSALEAERQRLKIPGMAIAVIENDRVVLLEGHGVRNLETREPVDSLTLFPIGSCTKAFTAMAAVICQDDGKLSLDDHPRRFLPWFHMADPEADQLVTLRDMLSHRTGLKAYADLAAEPAVLSRVDYIRAATGARPVARFREKFQYSNAMVTAVGEIVARAQGTTWERVIERRIFGPLGMTSSRALASDLPHLANHVTGYDDPQRAGNWKAVAPPASLVDLAPAGSIASNARDMARWVRFLLAEGTIDGKRVASQAGVREVMTPHTLFRGSMWYGLGWGLYDWNHHHVVEHNGGSGGISALVSLMPERRIGFVLLINTTPTSLTFVTQAGKILWPILLNEREAPPPPAPATAAAVADSAALDTLGLPPARDVLARMLAAAGGARNLRHHAALEMRSHKRYWNQGVESDVRVVWGAPDRLVTDESWTAVGKSIGHVRSYFDGARGGQETTFGQDQIFSGAELGRARRDAALTWLAEPYRMFPTIRVLGRKRLGGEDALLLEMRPEAGDSTVYAVSARTYLIVERTSAGTVEAYSDFRNVGGVVLPFRDLITDAFGETELTVQSVRFDAPVAASAFAPHVAPRAAQAGPAPH